MVLELFLKTGRQNMSLEIVERFSLRIITHIVGPIVRFRHNFELILLISTLPIFLKLTQAVHVFFQVIDDVLMLLFMVEIRVVVHLLVVG